MSEDLVVLEDGIPIFNPAARLVPAFNKIVVRARKKTGSYHGQKDLATMELGYVWFMENFKSPYQKKYPDNEFARDEAARRKLKLEDWNALEDKDIIEARKEYVDGLNYDIDEALLKNARSLANRQAEYFEGQVAVADPNSNDVLKRPQTVMKDLREVGSIIDDLKDLEDRVRRSEGKANVFGKKSKGVYEDPPDTSKR